MSDLDKTVWVVFNGEIYNFVELRDVLTAEGATFRTRSDTEVILEGYRRWGSDVVKRLHGMFAFVIWDRQRLSAFAARDRRYGEDPGWRLWVATVVAAAATAACFATLRTASSEVVTVPLIGEDPSGVTAQVAAFWLISSGVAILVTARTPVRGTLGALLMVTGVELLVRLLNTPQLGLTLLLAWVEAVIALAGAFLIVNERVVREA